MKYYKMALLLMTAGALFSFVSAQTYSDYSSPSLPSLIPGLEEQMDISVSPQNPTPNQDVTITLKAYGTDLNRADISWLINGQVRDNGVGKTTFTFKAGSAGSVSLVTIYILPVNGTKITKEVRVAPASVDLVWEARDSYTPPFYKGKKLFPPQGSLLFVAMPNLVQSGVAIDPKTLVYKWTLNNSIQGDKSGYGKNTFNINGDILKQTINIKVEASSIKDNVVGSGQISVIPTNPELALYENNPLYGILFNKKLAGTFTLKTTEVTINAMPYYFGVTTPTDVSMNYAWKINNASISLPANQSGVVFRRPDALSNGQSSVAIAADNSKLFLQSAATSLLIDFQTNNNSNVTPF